MKDALIALGMGGPDSIGAIEPFLVNLLSDRDIINFGVGETLQRIIAGRIAATRAKKIAPHYEKMGGGSPQLRLTQAFLKKLTVKYTEKTGITLDAYPAMCYWHPLIKNTVINIMGSDRCHGYRRIILLPMYPQYSVTTTGACFNHFRKTLDRQPPCAPLVEIYHYHMHQPYLEVLASRVRVAADKLGTAMSETHLLFSAHSLPQSVADSGDPYVGQLQEQCAELVSMLKPKSHSLAYQSKLGRMKWLTPSVRDELTLLAGRGVKNVVVLAISFINDHIETLIELDEDLLCEGRKMGLNIMRAETPNDADDFVSAMADLLSGV